MNRKIMDDAGDAYSELVFGRLGAVLEAPALVAGLDDVAMMGEAVEQRGRHLGIAEHSLPFAEGEIWW
jgi:hypothetical protein